MEPGEEIAALRARVHELEVQARSAAANAELLRAVLEAVPAFVLKASPDFRILFINRIARGLEPSRVLGSDLRDWITAPHRALMEECARRALQTRQSQHFELDGQGDDGELRHYISRLVPCEDEEGPYLVLAAFDVTELRQKQQALQESSASLQMALDATKLGLWSWDIESDKVTWNNHMRTLCGVDVPVAPASYLALVHPEDRGLVAASIEKSIAQDEFESPEHRLLRADGSIRWVLSFGKTLRDERRKARKIIGGSLDITERRYTEEQLRRSQKMDAVGQLTAGVAHNFNNMLSIMLPTLQLLQRSVPPERQAMVLGALEAGQKAADLIQKMVRFAGEPVMIPQRLVRADDLARRAVDICRRVFAAEILLEERYEMADLLVSASGSDLEQVLVNLLLNARDALENTVAPRIAIAVWQQDGQVQLSVSDNGHGIAEPLREKLFEPFFTTKEPGRGTGLGLATAYAIVRDHGGSIHHEPSLTRGTTFVIRLPLRAGPIPAPPTTTPPEQPTSLPLALAPEGAQRRSRRALWYSSWNWGAGWPRSFSMCSTAEEKAAWLLDW